jgi:uncharacterized RDD family membrane protein YckC
MSEYSNSKSALPSKRVISLLIDILISVIPCLLLVLNKKVGFNLDLFFYMTLVLIFYTSLSTVLIGRTVGDVYLKLQIVNIDGNLLSKGKLILRNLMIYCLVGTPFLELGNLMYTVISGACSLYIGCMMFSRSNIYREQMTAIDMVFKTIVISQEKIPLNIPKTEQI